LKEICLQHGIKRDGEQARSQWENDLMKEEEKYILTFHPHLQAEIIISGMPGQSSSAYSWRETAMTYGMYERPFTKMPFTYRFDSKIIVIEMAGKYSLDEIRQAIHNLFADPECPTNASLIINLTDSESIINRSPEEIKKIANVIVSISERFNCRIALVAPKDLPYDMKRMTSVGSSEKGIESEVFRTIAEAQKWLLP
jgi:hypothetical protein